jgi:hypothetical protein
MNDEQERLAYEEADTWMSEKLYAELMDEAHAEIAVRQALAAEPVPVFTDDEIPF